MSDVLSASEEDAHTLTDAEIQEILDDIASGSSGALLQLKTRVPPLYAPKPRLEPPQTASQVTRLWERSSDRVDGIIAVIWLSPISQRVSHFFRSISSLATTTRALRPRGPLATMAWLVSITKRIVTSFVTFLIGIFFVVPLGFFALVSTSAAVGFLYLLIAAKTLSDGCDRLTTWWFSSSSDLEQHPPTHPTATSTTQDAPPNGLSHSRQPSNAGSQSSTTTPRSARSNSDASLASMPNPHRDYEGVGGWKADSQADDQAIFMNMNSGLGDLSHSPAARRRRSFGMGSSGLNSPEIVTGGAGGRQAGSSHHLRRTSGTVSPQSYFSVPVGGGSFTAINSRRSSRVLVQSDRARVESESVSGGSEEESAVV